jgi:SAM-dependent methyltransferase
VSPGLAAPGPAAVDAGVRAARAAERDAPDLLAVEPQPACPVCGGPGTVRYAQITDRFFGVAGRWNFRTCDGTPCGTLWLDPRPTPADIGKAYRRYHTHGDVEPSALEGFVYRWLARAHAVARYGYPAGRLARGGAHLLAAAVALYPGLSAELDRLVAVTPFDAAGTRRVLDVGCGDGGAASILAALGWSASGVDVDDRAVAVARRRGLDARAGTIAEVGLDDGSFDLVVASHVIEHVHDPVELLAQARRALRPGGRLVVMTPNARAPLLGWHGARWRALDPPRHLAIFAASGLGLLAARAGFRDVQVTTTARAAAFNDSASLGAGAGPPESFSPDARPPSWSASPFFRWARGRFVQAAESALVRLGLAEGEELLLVARR